MSTQQTRHLSSPGWCMALLSGAMFFLSSGVAAQGYWRLEGSRVWVGSAPDEPKNYGKVTWDGFNYTGTQHNGKDFGCRATWGQPPRTLIPGETLEMKFSLEITKDPGGYHLGCSITALLHDEATAIGFTGGIDLFNNRVHRAPRNPSVERGGRIRDEQIAKAPVPDVNKPQKLYLRVGAGPGSVPHMKGIYYNYSWVPGAAPPAASVPPGSPPGSTPSTPSTPSAQAPVPPRPAPAAPASPGNSVALFNNWNVAGVGNGPTAATTFTLSAPALITNVTNYHWNDGRGATAGTITLRGQDGKTYGPWNTRATPGSGAQNVNWIAEPHETLPAGAYTVIDSDPPTWSRNAQSGGHGFTQVHGILQRSAVAAPEGGAISEEITGIWTSNYGQVSFTGSNRALGGTWNQPQGRGQITGGAYDPQSKRLFFYYTQSWNHMNGRADLTFSGSGPDMKLLGGWKQWPIGKTEADVARTGSWSMSKE